MSTVPSSPADRQKIKMALEAMTASMDRIAAEKEHMKDVIDKLKEEHAMEPKTTRKMAKTMYDRSYSDLQQENEDFELLYEAIVENMSVSGDDGGEENDDTSI